jgi:hypothetical protein
MQLLKEGQGQGQVVRTRRLDQGDGFGECAAVPASDAVCELVWR